MRFKVGIVDDGVQCVQAPVHIFAPVKVEKSTNLFINAFKVNYTLECHHREPHDGCGGQHLDRPSQRESFHQTP